MTGTNLERVERLIGQLLQVIPLPELSEAVIFGSAAVTLNGTQLTRMVDYLDLFVSAEGYERLRSRGTEVEKTSTLHCLMVPALEVEVWASFPGVDYPGVLSRARVLSNSRGLLVAVQQDIEACKRAQNRAKDRADLGDMGLAP